MNHFIEVKEIEIPELEKSNLSENYPESGFWLVKTKRTTDLRFVDKEASVSFCICPEQVYKAMGIVAGVLPNNEEITDLRSIINIPPGYVSEYFVMDLAKILLNSKK